MVRSEASLLRLWIVSYHLDQTDFLHPENEKREKSLELASLFTGARQGLCDLTDILSFHINPVSKCTGELELYRGTFNGRRLSLQYRYY